MQKPIAGSAEALARLGKSDFARGNYEAAIVRWERARRMADVKPELRTALDTALAEAHFRLALAVDPPNLEHMEQAVSLAPHDTRLRCHLARVYWVYDKIDAATAIYRQLLAEQPPCRRAALPLALALMSTGVDFESDPVWEHLTPDEQQRIRWVDGLLNKRADWVLRNAPVQGADACWGGLARVALSEAEALPVLEAALGDPAVPPFTTAVLRYYRGVLLARQGINSQGTRDRDDTLERALAEWRVAQQTGYASPWLSQNIVAGYQHRLNNLLQGVEQGFPGAPLPIERLQEAYALVEEGLELVPDQAQLMYFKYFILSHLGYAEAMAGRWTDALAYWQAADDCHIFGYDRTLAINLALAYEKNEQYAEAAELWRSVIRHRPRRSDAPHALNEAQTARVWQHVAECYRKAGNYAEAIQTYRNAVKWAPHNLELQLGLVEVLMADDRPSAALTVVQQVLKSHPDHVEALAWRAEIYEAQGWLSWAIATWERVLQLEPQHARARPHLARLFEMEGDHWRRANQYEQAVERYQRGLEYWPHNARMRAMLGMCQACLRQAEVARQTFEETLSLGEPKLVAYYWVIYCWLELGRWNEALAVLDRAEQLEPPPSPGFYLDLGASCMAIYRDDWATALWERALARFPDDVELLVKIAIAYGEHGEGRRAIPLLRRAIEVEPDNGLAHLWLANYYYMVLHQKRLAERHWRIAEELAQKANNRELLMFIHTTRDYFSSGRRTLPPQLVIDLLEGIIGAGGLDGFDEEDDSDYVPDLF